VKGSCEAGSNPRETIWRGRTWARTRKTSEAPRRSAFTRSRAVEKLLKAVLASFDVIPEEHHDLARLLAQVRLLDRRTADTLPGIARLTPYAAQYRYPPRPGRVHGLNKSEVLADLETARSASRSWSVRSAPVLEASLLNQTNRLNRHAPQQA